MVFRVEWDDGAHACGVFGDRFDTYEEAYAFGKEWAYECNVRDFGTAEPDGDCYAYEVIDDEET